MIIALAILAYFACMFVYMCTDLHEHARELLDELAEQEWDAQYDEAMQWRDWQTCDYLIEERAQSSWYAPESPPAPHRAGERGDRPDSLRSSALRGLTAPAGATVFDWDADGFGDAA